MNQTFLSEKELQNKVLRDLRKIPDTWFFKTNDIFVNGIPDIIGCHKGTFFALELKREKNSKTSLLQHYTIRKINEAKGYATIVKPSTWDKIYKEFFK